jgi:hypothetical protein
MLHTIIYNNNDDMGYGYFCDPEYSQEEYPGYTAPLTTRSTTSTNIIVNIDYYELKLRENIFQPQRTTRPQQVGIYKFVQTKCRVLSNNIVYMIGHICRDYSFIKLYKRFSEL